MPDQANGQYEKYLLKQGYTSNTVRSYILLAQQFIEWAENQHIEYPFITYPQLMDYLKHLKNKSIKQQTISNYCNALRPFFTFLITQNLTDTNPFYYLKVNVPQTTTLHTLLTKEQLEGLHAHFDIKARRLSVPTDLLIAKRQKMTIGLMVYQGLETNALEQLTTHSVDLSNGTITITENRKHAARTLALNAPQIMELYQYIHEVRPQLIKHYTESDSLLVHGYKHYRDAHRRLMQQLKKQQPVINSAGQIKASVITLWLKQYNLREVQYMAGHKCVSTTERYQRADTEALKQDIDRFHPLN